MMRFQRVSPDCQPLRNGNGRKSNSNSNMGVGDTCKDEDNGSGKISTAANASSSNSESKSLRFRSPSRNQENHFRDVPDSPQRTEDSFGHSHSGGGDVLLQWGHRKRSRVSRAEIRPSTEESSSSLQSKPVQRRINHTATTPKLSPASTSMPPPPPTPPPPPPLPSSTTSTNVRCRKDAHRNLDDPSVAATGTGSESPSRNSHGGNRLVSRSAARKPSPSCLERSDRRIFSSGFQRPSGSSTTQAVDRLNNHMDSACLQSEQEAKGERGASFEVIEWPKIFIALSRKEKEDDFFAMKGTKLPQRPKKRAKNVDRSLQYCFPGMWLSDLTKSRYEVREKKCVKKQKRRGLKGMESLESESE